jgi:hypothetical protein
MFDIFNTALSKRLKLLKKDLGAVTVSQGYKGTGSRVYRRQIFVRFSNDKVIDLWLEDEYVLLGGVCMTNYGKVIINQRNINEVYDDVVNALRPLSITAS